MENFGSVWKTADTVQPFRSIIIRNPKSEVKRRTLKPPESWKLHLPPSILLTISNGSCATLFDYIELHGRVPLLAQRSVFAQTAGSIAFLHNQQIVHGDIKEENLLLKVDSYGYYHAKLCDFGHAKRVKRAFKEMRFYGTRDISSPELLSNIKSIDERSRVAVSGYAQDVWALGIILFTIIHGSLPCNNDLYLNSDLDLSQSLYFPTTYDASISPDCLNLLHRLLCINPADRISMSQVMMHPWIVNNSGY